MSDNELAQLDLAVARAEGFNGARITEEMGGFPVCVVPRLFIDGEDGELSEAIYEPTRDWTVIGEFLEKYDIRYDKLKDEYVCWVTGRPHLGTVSDKVLRVAICRTVVALKTSRQ